MKKILSNALIISVLAVSPHMAFAEVNVSFTPRLWYSIVSSMDQETSEALTVKVPLVGGSLSFASEKGTLSITAFHGKGDETDTVTDTVNAVTFTGNMKADVTRTDVEVIWQQPWGEKGASWFVGGRYVRGEADQSLSGSGTVLDNQRIYESDVDYYLTEVGAGSANLLDGEGKSHLFGNITLMAGYSKNTEKTVPAGTSQTDSGLTLGIDTNMGYAYKTSDSGVFSARYRIMTISDPDVDFSGVGEYTLVHGPEVGWKFDF